MQIPTIKPMSYITNVARQEYAAIKPINKITGHWFAATDPLLDKTVSVVTEQNVLDYFYSASRLRMIATGRIPRGYGRWSVVINRQPPQVLHEPDYFDSGFVHAFICGTQEHLPIKAYSYHREGVTNYTTYMTLLGEVVLDCVYHYHRLHMGY